MRLLDSNTVVHYLQGRPPVVARMQKMAPQDLRLPSVVASELNYGTFKQSGDGCCVGAVAQAPFDASAAV